MKLSKEKFELCALAITLLAAVEITALYTGHNGIMLTATCTSISGIVGVFVGKKFRNHKEG